jgi:hypothetical protein
MEQTLTEMYFVYFWDLVFWLLVIQATFVALLIMPMPSNKIRGVILTAIDRMWTASPHVCIYLLEYEKIPLNSITYAYSFSILQPLWLEY